MNRMSYIVSAPAQHDGPAALVELRPFKAALACEDGVVCVPLQSYSSRRLRLEIQSMDSPALVLRPCQIELQPGACERIRIGLRLGALQVERAFCLVLREVIAPRRDASFLAMEIALPLIVTPLAQDEALRAA